MSKEGSYEYEMDKIARMVLTVIHTRRKVFNIKLLENRYPARDIAQCIYSFFGYQIDNMKLNQLTAVYPDVFYIKYVGQSLLADAVCTLDINTEHADLLEIW